MSGFGALVEQFRNCATPADARYGASPQAVVEEFFTYLYSYGVWAGGSGAAVPPFATGGSGTGQQAPTYQVLKDCQTRLGQFSGNLIAE